MPIFTTIFYMKLGLNHDETSQYPLNSCQVSYCSGNVVLSKKSVEFGCVIYFFVPKRRTAIHTRGAIFGENTVFVHAQLYTSNKYKLQR